PSQRNLGGELMTTTSTNPIVTHSTNAFAAGQLHRRTPWLVFTGAALASIIGFWFIDAADEGADFNVAGAIIVAAIGHVLVLCTLSYLIEGARKAKDRLVTALVVGAFLLALAPLISLLATVTLNGLPRLDLECFPFSLPRLAREWG